MASALVKNVVFKWGSGLCLEANFEHSIELMKSRLQSAIDFQPATVFQGSNGQAEFQFEGIFGLKISSAVATNDFQLTIDGFQGISGAQGAADSIWIFEEGQIVVSLFAQLGHEAGVAILEALTELFKLSGADLLIPGRFQGAPALLKLGAIGLG